MSETTTKQAPAARNGVNVPTLFATIDAVRDQPELADFKWRARNSWRKGTHSQTTMETFSGAGGDHEHAKQFTFDADHPAVLVGEDNGPTPVEILLASLASCLTSGVANIASARGIDLDAIESTIVGDMNLQGILGLSDEIRNGYQRIQVDFKIEGDAPEEKLRQVVEQSRSRSAVFDVVTNGVPVDISVNGNAA